MKKLNYEVDIMRHNYKDDPETFTAHASGFSQAAELVVKNTGCKMQEVRAIRIAPEAAKPTEQKAPSQVSGRIDEAFIKQVVDAVRALNEALSDAAQRQIIFDLSTHERSYLDFNQGFEHADPVSTLIANADQIVIGEISKFLRFGR